MRTTYSIYPNRAVSALLIASQAVLDALTAGIFHAEVEPGISQGVAAANALEAAVTHLSDHIPDADSPFGKYRHEILGHYSTARRLQGLTLHLWNDGNPVHLASLFGNADGHHTRIALEMIASYATRGENDPAFMRLADEIRDRRAEEAEQAVTAD